MKTDTTPASLTDAELHDAIAHVGLVLSGLEQDHPAYAGNMLELTDLLRERLRREGPDQVDPSRHRLFREIMAELPRQECARTIALMRAE